MAKLLTCADCGENKQEKDIVWVWWESPHVNNVTIPVCKKCFKKRQEGK
jgi:hypothetical protein